MGAGLRGNVIAETAGGGATGSTGTVREYIWLYETEIAPTMASRAELDRPLAVVNAVNTVSPATWYVHVDHLNRPKKMTDGAKASVWDAVWQPWGAPYTITGSATLDARFPGQWFQLEAGLNYNWYRHYDPTLGRYTQPDPLGFVDGPSVYAYARSAPHRWVDPEGRSAMVWPAAEAGTAACGPICGVVAAGAVVVLGDWCANKIREWSSSPPANDDECPPGFCCKKPGHQGESADSWGRFCHYDCPHSNRSHTIRMDSKHAQCPKRIADDFDIGRMGK